MDPRYCGARRVSVDRIDRDILQRERLIMNLYRNNFSTSVQYYDVMRHWNLVFHGISFSQEDQDEDCRGALL